MYLSSKRDGLNYEHSIELQLRRQRPYGIQCDFVCIKITAKHPYFTSQHAFLDISQKFHLTSYFVVFERGLIAFLDN